MVQKKIHQFLNEENIKFIQNKVLKEYFSTDSIQKVLKSSIMKNGLVSVQNPANGLVVKLLNPQSNQIIFDGCAAPGGKSTYINELTNGNIKLHSYDNDEKRIKIMEKHLNHLNINNIKCHSRDLMTDSIPNYKIGLTSNSLTDYNVSTNNINHTININNLIDINQITFVWQ